MKVDTIARGQIWMLNNMYPPYDIKGKELPEYHNYIVVAEEPDERFGTVQMMEITSLKGRDPIHEVPIVLENGCISYIVTCNIHSVRKKEILNNGIFKGCLVDNPEIKAFEFVNMLIQMYCSINKFITSNRYTEVLQEEFRKYLEYFNKNFGKYPRYSEQKKIDNKFIDKRDDDRFRYSNHQNMSPEDYRYTLEGLQEKFNVRSDISSNTADDHDDIVYSDGVNAVTKLPIPDIDFNTTKNHTYDKFVSVHDVPVHDKIAIKQFKNYPHRISDWTDEQLMLWIRCYKKYAPNVIISLCNRWNAVKSVYQFEHKAIREAECRHIALV